ncbi:MAG: DNA adenine modification methylase [Psychrobacter sp.]|nr:DNA adenine modification methylase [Psychrobacter sp.]
MKDFLETYHKPNGLFADPSIGGGTSIDVAKELGVNFFGTDLHQGFNLLTDDLTTKMGQQADTIFWHPPYWDMVKYSENVWGNQPNPWDLSAMSLTDFNEALVLALMNIHDATQSGGYYGILMGNLRRKGTYYNLSSLVERVAPAPLVDEIIKVQNNCRSDSKQYNSKLVRIAHEKLMVFRKKAETALYFLTKTLERQDKAQGLTWKAAVRRILQQKGAQMQLTEIYEAIAPYAKARENEHWKAQVRKCLQDTRYFTRIDTGVFEMVR